MTRGHRTFIDTNILLFMCNFEKYQVDKWLEQLYDIIYIHKDIMDEIQLDSVRQIIQTKIKMSETWQLFDPDDEQILTEEDYIIYHAIYDQYRQYFSEYQEKRINKMTSDLGDIGILTGCQFLKIPLITSHDGDFKEMINQYELKINQGLETDLEEWMKVDSLFDIGDKLIEKGICKTKEYKKFIKVSLGASKINQIDAYFGNGEQM